MAELSRLAILTGRMRAGKTTAARRLAGTARAAGWRVGGFVSLNLVDGDGSKTGIAVEAQQDGERKRLASTDVELGGPRIGIYSFDASVLRWAERVWRADASGSCDLVLLDEVGLLEIDRNVGFASLLTPIGEGGYRSALVVVRYGYQERLWYDDSRVVAQVFEVEPTPDSRESIPAAIWDWLQG